MELGSGKDGAGTAFVRVKRQPIGRPPQFRFGRGVGIAQQQLEVRAVLQIGNGNNTGTRFHSVHEAQDIGQAGLCVEVAAEKQGGRIPCAAAGQRLRAVHELIGLDDSVHVVLEPVVNARQHSGAVGGGEKSGAFGVEHAALAGAGDKSVGSSGAEGGNVMLRIAASLTLALFGVIGRHIDDLRHPGKRRGGRMGDSGAGCDRTGGAAVSEQQAERKEEQAFHEEHAGSLNPISQLSTQNEITWVAKDSASAGSCVT